MKKIEVNEKFKGNDDVMRAHSRQAEVFRRTQQEDQKYAEMFF